MEKISEVNKLRIQKGNQNIAPEDVVIAFKRAMNKVEEYKVEEPDEIPQLLFCINNLFSNTLSVLY